MQATFFFISLVIIVVEYIPVGVTGRLPIRRLEEKNKAIVLKFYQRLFGDKDFSAIDDYLGDSFTQHNPTVEDGKEGLRKATMEWLKDEPKTKLDVRRVGADGDLVWVHVRSPLLGKIRAVMDAFRVAKGKIVEHWDVIQEVPATSKNSNTMF